MTHDYEFVHYRVHDGVIEITLNRPPFNILNLAMIQEVEAALLKASKETEARILVFRAEGKLFSAGVDVADHTSEKVGEMIPLFDRTCRALAEFPAPTLAVVHGPALGGGCELVICCDLAIASETASLGQPEIKLAMVAPVAALRLRELVGYRHAADLLFGGESLSAADAARIGLINRAVPAGELSAAADEIIARISRLSAPALRLCKKAVHLGSTAWKALPEMEQLYLHDLMSTEDAVEGLSSFLLKRAPQWKHR